MMMFSWWCIWSKDQSMMMMLLLIERPKYWGCCWKMLLIKRSKCWRCCWSKGQSTEDVAEVVADRKVKILKMLLIKRSKYWRCCWSCCWSRGQSIEDVDADRKVKVLMMMLLIERSKYDDDSVAVTEDWKWRLHDVEEIPMIYRCVTLIMLMMSSISRLLLFLLMLL